VVLKTLDEINREFMAERFSDGKSCINCGSCDNGSKDCINSGSVSSNSDNVSSSQEESVISKRFALFGTKPSEIEAVAEVMEPGEAEELRNSSGEPETKRTGFSFSQLKLPQLKLPQLKREVSKEKSNLFVALSDVLFYVALLVILFSMLASSGGAAPKSMMGYSFFTVQSASMQKEIPKGSFIIVKHTAAEDLRLGDNITFMRERGLTVTHKIIDIYEDYPQRGSRGFQTKGVSNAKPDEEIVSEGSIVGKVVFSIPGVGPALSFLSGNLHLALIMFVLCIIISFSLRGIFGKTKKEAGKETSLENS